MAKNDPKPLPPLSASDIARFWSKVTKRGPDECWPWIGVLTHCGYGQFLLNNPHRTIRSNRAAFFLHFGKDPLSLHVCHSCDVRYAPGDPSYRMCCNPTHLFLGTHLENVADMIAKGRGASGDRSGPRLHPEAMRRVDANGVYLHSASMRRGVDHPRPCAKLAQSDIAQIRKLYAEAAFNQTQLAERFQVRPPTISKIITGKLWAHIP